jgi:hypothetical protein
MSIAVTPTSPGGAILRRLVASPGGWTCEALALALHPYRRPPPQPVATPDPRWARLGLAPVFSRETYRAWRRTPEALAAAEAAHASEVIARTARTLSRLQQQGLVEPRRELVTLTDTAQRLLATRAPADLLAALADADEAPEDDAPADPADATLAASMLGKIADRPRTRADLLGPRPSGAANRALASLAEAGLVHLPQHRWPTDAGIALVRGWDI